MEALDKKLKDDTAAAADREAKLHEDIRQLQQSLSDAHD